MGQLHPESLSPTPCLVSYLLLKTDQELSAPWSTGPVETSWPTHSKRHPASHTQEGGKAPTTPFSFSLTFAPHPR